jgi:hypothetical protein
LSGAKEYAMSNHVAISLAEAADRLSIRELVEAYAAVRGTSHHSGPIFENRDIRAIAASFPVK